MERIILLFSFLMMSFCIHAQVDVKVVRRIIEQQNELYRKAYLTGDSALFARLHHSKTINMPPNSSILYGQGAIAKTVIGGPYQGIKDMIINISAVYGGPQYVIEEGTYVLKTEIDQHDGKYMVVWKQELGTWKIYRAIWNLNKNW